MRFVSLACKNLFRRPVRTSLTVAGVALAGVQELLKQNQELKAENENMKSMISDLERRLAEVEKNSR